MVDRFGRNDSEERENDAACHTGETGRRATGKRNHRMSPFWRIIHREFLVKSVFGPLPIRILGILAVIVWGGYFLTGSR